MKSYFSAAIIFAALLLTVPAAPLAVSSFDGGREEKIEITQTEESATEKETDQKEENEKTKKSDKTDITKEKLKVLDITTGKVEEITSFDYIVGAVCAEMPATFEPEALKAQAVAAYTYAVRQREKAKTAPDPELNGAYFSNDSSKYQAYFTENQQKQYYGKNYEQYIEKIKDAVLAVNGEYMTYKDEPVIAAFHSASAGRTESAEDVWGSRIEYLVGVESEYDTTAPKFIEEYEFTQSEIKESLEKVFEGISLQNDPKEWFGETECSDGGTVLTIKVGDMSVTGQQLRFALSLRSAVFEVEYDDEFKITTKGCGHCVGMSQYGANEMAKTGKTYDEILKHYYTGVKIIS